ncbi:hypothetical protein KUV51_16145 [Tateyamaria omphalii]|uniref:hypothetical protein n=1 Tax=Tateyamaria omphalii TaxID=299262 RepID=UPI001C995FCF|nr:hypothetical protein [Tateyamaria omphalii]MBY5934541.1 hypothetical protein [Tateyamaria omphalii]
MRLFLILFLLAGPALSQDWAVRSADTPLDRQAVMALVEGNTLTFFDDGQSKFSAGGAYSYTYANGGGTAFGRYEVGVDGTVCIAFRNGFGRCDKYVESAGRVVMLTEKGERFPIRP